MIQLDSASLSTLLEAADRELVVLALVGAPPSWIARFLDRMPDAEARSIARRLDHPGPTRLSDVEEARRELAELAWRLAAVGGLRLPETAPTPVLL